jgi:hypothetical protein
MKETIMTATNNIRYRPDGSIDTSFYMARGRHMRSCQAHAMMGSTPDQTRRAPANRTLIWG